jgi:hypothetical protein
MSVENLRRLAERAEDVQGRQTTRLTEVHDRIRTARRHRAALGSAAAGVVIALVVAGAALTQSNERPQDPVDDNTVPQTPTEAPAGQTTLRPQIGPGDIRGWELVASRTNTQEGIAGDTDLALTVETGGLYGEQSSIATFCNGDPGTWWVLTMDLGGVDGQRNTDGSMQDGTRGMFGRCAPNSATTVPPATGDIGPWQWNEAAGQYPVRMFVTDAVPPAAQQCLGGPGTDGCAATHGVVPLEESDATFGFGVYEHREAPIVMTVPGARFQALAIAEGIEYLVDRAVLAAKGADRLVVRLPQSDRSRIVAVYHAETPAFEDCVDRLGHRVPTDAREEQAQVEEVDRRCLTELELRIDGARPPQDLDFSFSEHQALLPPGAAREVTVEVLRNDPRNVRYALVIWEERR